MLTTNNIKGEHIRNKILAIYSKNNNPIHNAVLDNDMATLTALIDSEEAEELLSETNSDGHSAVHLMVLRDMRRAVKCVCDKYPRIIEKRNKEFMNILHYAVIEEKLDMVDLIVDRVHGIVRTTCLNKENVLQLCLKGESNEILFRNLLSKDDSLMFMQNADSYNPFHTACNLGMTELACFMVKLNKNVTLETTNQQGLTGLDICIKNKNMALVKALVDLSIEVPLSTFQRVYAMEDLAMMKVICDSANYKIVVLARGYLAILESTDINSLFYRSCLTGDDMLAQLILDTMPDIIHSSSFTAASDAPLLHAIVKGTSTSLLKRVVQLAPGLLLDKNMTNGDKNSKLSVFHYVCSLGGYDMALFLHQYRPAFSADLDAQGRNGLYYAIQHNQENVLKLLLVLDDKMIYNIDKFGKSILHHVTDKNDYGSLQLILNRINVDGPITNILSARDHASGRTFIHQAYDLKQYDIVENLIRDYKQLVLLTDAQEQNIIYLLIKDNHVEILTKIWQHCNDYVNANYETMITQLSHGPISLIRLTSTPGYDEMTLFLLKHFPVLVLSDYTGSDDLPISIAYKKGNLDIVNTMLDVATNSYFKEDKNAKTIVHYVCEKNDVDVFQLLCERVAQLDNIHIAQLGSSLKACIYPNGQNLLDYCYSNGYSEIVNLLCSKFPCCINESTTRSGSIINVASVKHDVDTLVSIVNTRPEIIDSVLESPLQQICCSLPDMMLILFFTGINLDKDIILQQLRRTFESSTDPQSRYPVLDRLYLKNEMESFKALASLYPELLVSSKKSTLSVIFQCYTKNDTLTLDLILKLNPYCILNREDNGKTLLDLASEIQYFSLLKSILPIIKAKINVTADHLFNNLYHIYDRHSSGPEDQGNIFHFAVFTGLNELAKLLSTEIPDIIDTRTTRGRSGPEIAAHLHKTSPSLATTDMTRYFNTFRR